MRFVFWAFSCCPLSVDVWLCMRICITLIVIQSWTLTGNICASHVYWVFHTCVVSRPRGAGIPHTIRCRFSYRFLFVVALGGRDSRWEGLALFFPSNQFIPVFRTLSHAGVYTPLNFYLSGRVTMRSPITLGSSIPKFAIMRLLRSMSRRISCKGGEREVS